MKKYIFILSIVISTVVNTFAFAGDVEKAQKLIKNGKTKQGITLIINAAKKGDPKANFIIGKIYFDGKGVKKNTLLGIKLLKVAAEKGHPQANFELGLATLHGVGILQNDKKAYKYFSTASSKSFFPADIIIAVMSYQEKGTKKSYSKSISYYKRVLKREQDSALALAGIADIYEKGGFGVSKNLTKSFKYNQKLADMGFGKSMEKIALAYLTGKGTKKSLINAHVYYNLASAAGSENASKKLTEVSLLLNKSYLIKAQDIANTKYEKIINYLNKKNKK